VDFAWRLAAKDNYLGGFPIFLGGFWPPRQFCFLVVFWNGVMQLVAASRKALVYMPTNEVVRSVEVLERRLRMLGWSATTRTEASCHSTSAMAGWTSSSSRATSLVSAPPTCTTTATGAVTRSYTRHEHERGRGEIERRGRRRTRERREACTDRFASNRFGSGAKWVVRVPSKEKVKRKSPN